MKPITAIHDNGVFRPTEPVDLPQGTTVRVEVAPSRQRLPRGAGKYRSGRGDTSHNVEQILRDAVKEGKWP